MDVDKRRNLILVSKVLQNLANNSVFAEKEAYMKATNECIAKNTPLVEKFLDEISVSYLRMRLIQFSRKTCQLCNLPLP